MLLMLVHILVDIDEKNVVECMIFTNAKQQHAVNSWLAQVGQNGRKSSLAKNQGTWSENSDIFHVYTKGQGQVREI